jgi:hypothetical protein
VNVLGGLVALRRPPQNNGHPFLGFVCPSDGSGEGAGGFLGAPRGEDFLFGMPDSVGNGSGTFGKWSWRKGDANKTQIMYLDGGTKRLTLEDGSLALCLIALTYSSSIATDATAGNIFTIIATNGTAFTISNPTNPFKGQVVTYDIKNSSGGAHGVITWGAGFLNGGAGTVGAGAFTGIANGKRRTISFYYDGTNWIELFRTADI